MGVVINKSKSMCAKPLSSSTHILVVKMDLNVVENVNNTYS